MTLWILSTIIYIYFISWDIKKTIGVYTSITGFFLTIITLIWNTYQLFSEKFLHKPSHYIPSFFFYFGVMVCITHFIAIFFSRGAWGDRDDSKDNIKFRLAFGICIKCKKKIPRLATKCPYCLTDLSH